MAYKPWYERVGEMDSIEEKQNFLKGVYSGYGQENHSRLPIIAGLIAGYIGGRAARKND